MGRLYAVPFSAVATTVAADLWEITPADDKPCRVVGMTIAQSSDVGDAAEEIIPFTILRGHTTSGSGGSAPTPTPLNPGDAAAAFTAEVNNTTAASTGTTTTLLADAFNIRAGYQIWFPPEARPMVSQANTTLVVRMGAAPADSLTMSGTLFVEED